MDSEPVKSPGISATKNTKGRAGCARPFLNFPSIGSSALAPYRATALPRHVPRPRPTGDVEQTVAQVAQGKLIGLAAGNRAGGAIAAAVAGRDVDLTDIDCADQAVTVC